MLAGQVDAQELFVDPTVVQRHAKGGPPKLVTPETLLTADPMHQFRHGVIDKSEGVEGSVLGAKRPAKVTTRFDGAGDTKTYAGQAAIKGAEGFAMGGYRLEDSGTYEGGNGEEVDAGYRREVRQFVTGWTPSPLASLKLIGLQDDITDEKQPHHGLDLLETDRKVGRGILETRDIFDTGVDFEAGLKVIDLDRRADNYSLRSNSGQKMRVAIDRRIWEGQGKASFETEGWENALTFTGTHDNHVARRYNVTNGDKVNSVRIPDVDRDTLALNLDTEKSFGAEQERTLKAGIRFERVNTAPGAADEVPGLRIVEDDLWRATRHRQEEISRKYANVNKGVRAYHAAKLNSLRRPAFLFSGLIKCGCCGGSYGIITRDRYGCLNRYRRGTCDNGRTIVRDKIEARVLAGLTEKLVSAEAVAEAVQAYAEGLNQMNREHRAQAVLDRQKLGKVERGIAGIMSAIEDGMYQSAMKSRMEELEQEKHEIIARMDEVPQDVPDIHPNIAEIYRKKVQNLTAALDDPLMYAEAADAIRSVVGEIIITPGDKRGDFQVSLRGELMGILDIATERRSQCPPEVITKVASGPRNQIKKAVPYGAAFFMSGRWERSF